MDLTKGSPAVLIDVSIRRCSLKVSVKLTPSRESVNKLDHIRGNHIGQQHPQLSSRGNTRNPFKKIAKISVWLKGIGFSGFNKAVEYGA